MTKKSLAAVGAGVALFATMAAPHTAYADTTTNTTTAGATAETATIQERVDRLLAQSNLSADLQDRIRAAAAILPSDWQARKDAAAHRYGIDSDYRAVAQSVIDPENYECGTTPLREWAAEASSEASLGLFLLSLFGGTDIPTYDALIFGHEDKSNTFGVAGRLTDEMNRTMTSLRKFWDIEGDDIQLIPMHGRMLQDEERVAGVYEVLYGMPEDVAAQYADLIASIVAAFPALNGGDHPLLTFNAFAFDPQGDPDLLALGITKRIVMGDGIVQGMDGAGVAARPAARGILAHEYGHQVQYAKDLFDSPLTGPEATRRTELMADSFGTYSLVHARGGAFNAKRTLAVASSFYNVGDCSFTSNGHHGTPNQRLAASEWAVKVVNAAPDEGHKLASLEYAGLFDAQLPKIVAPDAVN